MKRRCVICDERTVPPGEGGLPLCDRCYEAWKTACGKVDAMAFAARRARLFERARTKAESLRAMKEDRP